ncbi:HD domain-containing protein [Kitasatospora sp. NPDC004289]
MRHALLIGVGETPDAEREFGSLAEPVAADLAAMRTALEESGYLVETVTGREAGRSGIATAIEEAASAVPEGGTFLLYFSGHGVRHGRTDYLVPADARAPVEGPWRRSHLESLLPADVSDYLTDCRAGLVLWLMDACRDSLNGADEGFGTAVTRGQPVGRYAVVVGCSPGQRSGYSEEGSFFTRGLAEALGSLSAPRTVQEVFEAARARTVRSAAMAGHRQDAWIRYGADQEEAARGTEICGGRQLLKEWEAAVTAPALWEVVAPGQEEVVDRLRQVLVELVRDCARSVHRAQSRLPDPWADEDFPLRLLRVLPQLLPRGRGSCLPVEVAALAAAPFLHEQARADRWLQLAEIEPLSAERRPGGGQLRRHLEQVHDHYRHLARRLERCQEGNRPGDAEALALWLAHRWVNERFETDAVAVPARAAGEFAELVAGSRSAEFVAALRELAGQIGLDLPAESEAVREEVRIRPFGLAAQSLRIRPLAALLRLAAALAADARALPSVVADHLAVSDPVTPDLLLRVVRETEWERDAQGLLHLYLVSPHQAVHAAMAEVVERADRIAEGIGRGRERLPAREADLLAAVPQRVTDNHLEAGSRDGRARYEVPLLRFQLAQSEVRELLMGRQLYGEPELAIRELYQNAMDACRYREMRWRYLRSKGPVPVPWTGRIAFTQGVDGAGRRYVECRDNGVGMGREQLKSTFTRAGRRFEQSRSFRREQAAWLRHDPELRLYPNSRFGIGVLSYFMLAEEMTVVTREVLPDGAVAPHALRVEIPSSGSLFRIQQQTDPTEDDLPEGGTRVRLYLRQDADLAELSCVATLDRQVAVSEFAMEARDGHLAEEWVADVLRPGPWNADGDAQPAVDRTLWWVRGNGAVLCDGIVSDRWPTGYVLNLTGPRAGRLSVDRKTLQGYDREWETVTCLAGLDALIAWPRISMEWFWHLELRELPLARALWPRLKDRGLAVPVSVEREEEGRYVRLGEAGWCHLDRAPHATDLHGLSDSLSSALIDWRTAARWAARASERQVPPRLLTGYPVAAPGDIARAEVLADGWKAVLREASGRGLSLGDFQREGRALRICHPELAAPRLTPELARVGLSDGDLPLIDALDWRLPAQQTDRSFFPRMWHSELDGLLWASMLLRRPLGELVDRLHRLAPLHGLELPTVPDHHRDHVTTAAEIGMLYVDTGRVTTYWDVLEVAPDGDVVAVLDTLEAFGWLGWRCPDRSAVTAWSVLPAEVRSALTKLMVRREDGWQLLPLAEVALARELEITVRRAAELVAELAGELGLARAPGPERGESLDELIPSRVTAAMCSDREQTETGLGAMVRASLFAHPDKVVEAAAELSRLGVPLPPGSELIQEWRELRLQAKVVLANGTSEGEDRLTPAERMTEAGLFAAARRLGEPLEEVWALARTMADRFGLPCPELPPGLAGFRPGPQHSRALLETGEPDPFALRVDLPADQPKWKQLTGELLAEFAGLEGRRDPGDAYRELARVRDFGALVPELTSEQIAALHSASCDAPTRAALKDDYRVSDSGTPLVPLDLVSIAGRLGESVAEVWRRIEPYLPLGPAPQVPERPDVLPLWQDFAILSVYLDGLLPAVTGRVSREHVAFVAGEIGEGEEWVWDRLELYRGMFGLDLGERKQDG